MSSFCSRAITIVPYKVLKCVKCAVQLPWRFSDALNVDISVVGNRDKLHVDLFNEEIRSRGMRDCLFDRK